MTGTKFGFKGGLSRVLGSVIKPIFGNSTNKKASFLENNAKSESFMTESSIGFQS
jgi:hypothetical protein